jgi:hypothetical protein
MKKSIYSMLFVLFLLIPSKTFGQEDTCFVPDLYGTGLFLNTIIGADTSGTGWKGASGITAWQNHTRVYILQKNGLYPYNAQLNLRTNRKLVIRAEAGNYKIPAYGGDFRPQIYGYPVAGTPPGRFVNLNQTGDTLVLKNVSICGIDESQIGTIDKNQGNMLEIQGGGSGSIYVDSCVLKTVSGQIMQIGASSACHGYTISVTNSIIADMGFIGNSNLGAGRGFDFRNSEVDTIIVENNTFINWQDRVVRHYLSNLPIHSFRFNHNTLINGMSYCGTISLGLIDSLGNGPFEIKNNLFFDNFAMGPDTDGLRQSEFTDSPDKDPVNPATYKISWIVDRPNLTGHITPWDIANNYYVISDSGMAMRNLASPSYLHTPVSTLYPGATEPILTTDIWRQLVANGKDSSAAFRQVSATPKSVPPLMTKLIRWYNTALGDGTGGNTVDNIGAGAGRKKDGTNNTPASHFIHDVTNNVWVYDYNRRSTEWYMDSVDCSFSSTTNLATAATDGMVVGDTRWSFTLIGVRTAGLTPKTIDFGTVAKNASKTDTVVVTSGGNSALVVDSVKSSAAEFTVAPANATIAVGTSAKFVITYHPTTPGTKTGTLIFYHNGTSQQRDTVSVSGDVVSAASFSASATSLNLGTVVVGQSNKDSVTVTNHGTLALSITSVGSSNPVFTVTPTSASVAVEDSQKFYVTFTPTASGTQTGKIAFTHNALTHDTLSVSGNGSVTGVEYLEGTIPRVFELHSNYPNPFNPSTTILYGLPTQSRVVLKVYSLLGQEVASLMDGVQEAGYHRVVWNGLHHNAGQVASGMYLFRMSAQSTEKNGKSFTQVRKMILLK